MGARHLAGYRELGDRFRVTVLCDLDVSRARLATMDAPDVDVTSSIDSVIAASDIDLIDVCLPPHLHFRVSIRALEAGKHVVCEKPIVLCPHEADRLRETAETYGRKVFPVFQYRYGKGMRQLKALQKAGIAGKAYVASLETHWSRGADYYAVPWRGTLAGESGGAVLVHAIHVHDLLCHILGPVSEVFAMTDTRVNAIETEDCAALAFRMASGALATSSITLGADKDTTRLRFCFEGFTAESGSAPYAPAEDNWRFLARAPVAQSRIDRILSTIQPLRAGYAGYFEAVADAIDGNDGSEVTLDEGRRSIALAAAIYESTRRRAAVNLPQPNVR